MRSITVGFFICLFTLTIPGYSQENKTQREDHYNLDDDGLAIKGFDPVSYFSSSDPVKGKKSLQFRYNSVVYYFASEENRNSFKAQPQKYEPQYGGWCAYAMGDSGEKVKIDPETYKIVDGKLYLFYNFFFNNTLEDWNDNEKELKLNADKNWKTIIKE